jgi:enolase
MIFAKTVGGGDDLYETVELVRNDLQQTIVLVGDDLYKTVVKVRR